MALAGCGGSLSEPNLIRQFSAKRGAITAGQTANLSWQVAGAQNVSLSGVSATLASSAVVAPTHTTTYTLTATNSSGASVTRNVTVNVFADTVIATAIVVNPDED